uniref:Piezo domain-containing protein n=1 Tax=Panagrolaimus superbus TaxID=310955 RepID=A0A914YNX1_9BILA
MKSKDGSRIALGYQVKDMGQRKESSMSVKVNPMPDTPLASKKTSVTSLPSNTSKKSPKISLQFAEKLAAMKLEKERMKNLAKWENLKPILETIKSYSYVLALIILMAWSLCYHSWSTFVMLILSFVIWMHPNSQHFYYQIATFIVGYAEILLVCQFAFSLPFTQEELPDEKPGFLRQLGLEKPRNNAPVFDILLKSLFNLAFWYALKQKFIQQRTPKGGKVGALEKPKILVSTGPEKASSVSITTATTEQQSQKRPLIERIKAHISNFWVFLLLILLLSISLYNPVVFYRVGYMTFFLVFLSFFVISFPLWRKMLERFWMIMIGYCILVITMIYTYQFHGIPELYSDYLGMSYPVAKSLGLERISSSELLFRLLTPISFLIVSLIQLNFFHEKMMKSTQKWEDDVYGLKLRFLMAKLKLFHRQMNYLEPGLLEEGEEDGDEKAAHIKGLAPKQRMKKVIGEIERKCKQMLSYRQSIWNILWRFAEIHIDKIIAALIVYTAVKEISILNLPLIICVTVMIPFQTRIPSISDFVCVIASAVIILKMLFQMEFIEESSIQVTCFNANYGNENGTVVHNYGTWFGLTKVSSISDYTKEHISIILCLVFRELIKIRQFLHRKRNRLEEPPPGIIFFGIDRIHADVDSYHCLLYFGNYFFYKFGVEITFIASAISIGIRNDLIAVFYVLWLLYMLTRTRLEMSKLWIRYAGFYVICFGVQYLLCVGMPNFLCINYFWDDWDSNLIEWLCLPSYKMAPIPEKFIADFIVLLCITSQYYVFKIEEKFGPEYPGGDNHTISSRTNTGRRFIFNFDLRQFRIKSSIPLSISKVPDFISDGTTLLDRFKHVFFMYFYWITLSIIFIAGTSRITLFAAGYVFGCFFFLWMGNSLFFKPIVVCLQMWDNLIYYNVCVILLKTLLQIVGCVYMGDMCQHFCWLLQLFGIACNKVGYSPIELIDPEVLIQCDIPMTEAGIFYDNLCFVFLLIQRRIFGSQYFIHVIAELKAQRFFASRGAELIEKINKQEIEEAEEREKEMMQMVDKMVNKISKKQEKTKHKERNPEGILSDISSIHDEKSLLDTPDGPPPPNTVTIKDTIMVEVQGYCPTSPSETLTPHFSPSSEEAETLSVGSLDHMDRIQSPQNYYRQTSADTIRSPQPLSFDDHHRRKSANPDACGRQRSEDESETWSINSSDRPNSMKARRKTTGEGGVKGLGPLQLLNFAIKKGAIRDAIIDQFEKGL